MEQWQVVVRMAQVRDDAVSKPPPRPTPWHLHRMPRRHRRAR